MELVTRERPDVVLMDIRMPGTDGLEATRRITADERLANTTVLILTTFDLDEYVFQALRAGASGFLLKDTLPDDLLAAVRVVAAGQALLAPSVTRRLLKEFVRRPAAGADPSCPTMRVEIAVEVDELVEGNVIEAGYSAYRYRLAGDRFELVPESTPCGRTDCSTPSPTLSPCTTEAHLEAIERGIDGNIFLNGDQLCDGSFLATRDPADARPPGTNRPPAPG